MSEKENKPKEPKPDPQPANVVQVKPKSLPLPSLTSVVLKSHDPSKDKEKIQKELDDGS
jgi:hypothetical protein